MSEQDIQECISTINRLANSGTDDMLHYWMCDIGERAVKKLWYLVKQDIISYSTRDLERLSLIVKKKRDQWVAGDQEQLRETTVSISDREVIRRLKNATNPYIVKNLGMAFEHLMFAQNRGTLMGVHRFAQGGGPQTPFGYEELTWQTRRLGYLSMAWMTTSRAYHLLRDGSFIFDPPDDARLYVDETVLDQSDWGTWYTSLFDLPNPE
jgi:hypothetical protein